jgi:hypothetical protein
MRLRIASINDLPIKESERKCHWPFGRRPYSHLSLNDLAIYGMYPALLVRQNFCRSRRKRKPGRLEPPLRGLIGHRQMCPAGVQGWSRPRHHRGRDQSGLCPPEDACRVSADRTAGHSDGVLSQRRTVAQCFCDRKLHRRDWRRTSDSKPIGVASSKRSVATGARRGMRRNVASSATSARCRAGKIVTATEVT